MKKLILTIFICLTIAAVSLAQEETLLSGDIDHGGFGGLITDFSQVNDELGVMVGGYGAWLIDHTIALGGGGKGLVNDIKFDETSEGERFISFDYGGFYLGYLHDSNRLVHFTLETFIGGGEVNLSYKGSDGDELYEDDYVFVLDPTINAELNITSYMRFTLGAGYRYVSGVNLADLGNGDFSSPTLRASIRFGAF